MIIRRHIIFVSLAFTLMQQLTIACSFLPAPTVQGEKWVVFPAEQAKELGIGDWFVEDGQTPEY